MSATRSPSSRRPPLRPHPLALYLACALLASPVTALAAPAGAILVENCDDAGAGSLRAAVAAADSGAEIDLSGLACDTITLSSGAILVSGADLRLTGPGRQALTIDGGGLGRVVDHSGTGTLTLTGLTLTHGKSSGDGGCLRSAGHLALSDVAITGCTAAEAAAQNTRGGGAAVAGNATLTDVEFVGNVADGNLLVRGGGLAVNGTLLATRSRFVDNRARSHTVDGGNPFGNVAEGGGLRVGGDTQLIDSTISGNLAFSDSYEVFGGGLAVGTRGDAPLVALDMDGTRVAGNTAESQCGVCAPQGGGVWVRGGGSLSRVDVLDNIVTSPGHYGGGGGLRFTGSGASVEILDSTISGNRAASAGGGLIAPGQGTLSLERTRVVGNSAGNEGGTDEGGGGILSFGGAVQLTASSVTGNTAGADGGGLALLYMEYAPVDSTIVNSTISGNSAREGGGVMVSGGRVRFANSTVAFNEATRRGAGISSDSYTEAVELSSTIVSANSTGGQANQVWVFPKAIGGSHNLIDNAGGAPASMPADTITLDPQLLPLADNGGPTPTHALSEGSPAIDAGTNPAGLTHDQRGGAFVRAYGGGVDIGAFEVQPGGVDPKDRLFHDGFEP